MVTFLIKFGTNCFLVSLIRKLAVELFLKVLSLLVLPSVPFIKLIIITLFTRVGWLLTGIRAVRPPRHRRRMALI